MLKEETRNIHSFEVDLSLYSDRFGLMCLHPSIDRSVLLDGR